MWKIDFLLGGKVRLFWLLGHIDSTSWSGKSDAHDLSTWFFSRVWGLGCGTTQLIQTGVMGGKFLQFHPPRSCWPLHESRSSQHSSNWWAIRRFGFEQSFCCPISFLTTLLDLFFANLFVRQLGLWFNSLFTSVLLKSSEPRNTQLQDFVIEFSKLSIPGRFAAWLLLRWAHQKLKNLQDQGVVLTPECIFVAAVALGWAWAYSNFFGLIMRYFTKRANMSQINRALQYIEQNEEARWVKADICFFIFVRFLAGNFFEGCFNTFETHPFTTWWSQTLFFHPAYLGSLCCAISRWSTATPTRIRYQWIWKSRMPNKKHAVECHECRLCFFWT